MDQLAQMIMEDPAIRAVVFLAIAKHFELMTQVRSPVDCAIAAGITLEELTEIEGQGTGKFGNGLLKPI